MNGLKVAAGARHPCIPSPGSVVELWGETITLIEKATWEAKFVEVSQIFIRA